MRRIVSLVLATLLAVAPASWAQTGRGLTAAQLPARGTPAASDTVPCQPVGGGLEGCTVGALQGGGTVATPCNGTADDTSAILAAIAAGGLVRLPAGTCVISANLLLATTAANGVRIEGAGAPAQGGAGGSVTIVKPTSAVTKAFDVDGTANSIYVQNVRIANLGVDMTNMASGTSAFYWGQSFDATEDNLRVVGAAPSTGKLSFSFGPGSYVNVCTTCAGGIARWPGTGTNDPTTTIFVNPDLQQISADWASGISLIGGAVQPVYYSGMSLAWFAAGAATTPKGLTTTNTSGLYGILGGYLANVDHFTAIGTDFEAAGSYPTTASDGTHGTLSAYPMFQVGGGTHAVSFCGALFAAQYVADLNGAMSQCNENIGGGTQAQTNDTPFIQNNNMQVWNGSSISLFSDGGQTSVGSLGPSGLIAKGVSIKPGVAGDQNLCLFNVSVQCVIDFSQNGAGAIRLNYDSAIVGYTDNETTIGYNLTSSGTGNGLAQIYGGGSATITLTGSNGLIQALGLYQTPIGQAGTPEPATVSTLIASSVAAPAYTAGTSPGVSCAGAPTASFAVTDGIVTHC